MLLKKICLDIFSLGGGGGFKISSYTIIGVHPDIKIDFLKEIFGHTLQHPCKL